MSHFSTATDSIENNTDSIEPEAKGEYMGRETTMRITSEERAELKDEFLNENASIVGAYEKTIIEYWMSKELISERTVVDSIFLGYQTVETIAGNILFTLATMEPGAKPLQSVAGMISGMMSPTDMMQDRINAMHVAMELLLVSDPFVEFSWSRNNHPMIESRICMENLRTRNIYLPLERPTDEHKELGSFNWKMNGKNKFGKRERFLECLDYKNSIPHKIVILDEEPEHIPSDTDFTEEGCKQREKANKQLARQYLAKRYENKKVYFNWAMDYRGRQYSVGYYIQPQGNEVEKNMIEFYEGEKLSFNGILQLKKSIASAYGLSKKSDTEKLKWFFKNESTLHLRQRNAKDFYTFQTLVRAYKQYKKDPEAEITKPVELDATNGFAQIMSVILGKRSIAETCNVVNGFKDASDEKVIDLYQIVADEMSDIIANRSK